jgi:hypothetical protein
MRQTPWRIRKYACQHAIELLAHRMERVRLVIICTAISSVSEEPGWYASLKKRYDRGKGDARHKLSMMSRVSLVDMG